jgi:arylsulfatase A-like enzyme
MWKNGINRPGRVVEDWVSFIDLAPTFTELAGLSWSETEMAAFAGRSLLPLFQSTKTGMADPTRDHVLIGKERTDVGRPHDWGYPTRGLINAHWVYLHNFEPARWPAGNPETGYLDCDGGATKSYILQAHRLNRADPYWELCFGMRPDEELYDVRSDPDCLLNLAKTAGVAATKAALHNQLFEELRQQGDPRMLGTGDQFDRYLYANPDQRGFYERFMRGEELKAGWVSESDFEPTNSKAPAKSSPR